MQERRNFTLFADQRNVLSLLTDEQAGKLLRALYAYNDGEDPDITDQTVKVVYVSIKSRIDSVWERSETMRKNRLGKTKHNKTEQTITNDNITEQFCERKEKERSKERVKEKSPLSPNGDISPAGKNAPPKETVADVLAEQSQALIPVLQEFVEHRKHIKKPLSAHALRLNIAALQKLAPDDIDRQKYLAEYAIMKGWQGFYLPDEEKQAADKIPKPTTYAQQVKYEQDQQARALLAASQRRREANATQLSGNGGTGGKTQPALPPWWGPD